MSGFTPGPWFVDEYIPKDRFNAVHQHVGVYDGSGLSVVALCGPAGDEQSQKDAFLISAAPDLLEACKELLSEAVILSEDYLECFDDYADDAAIQGWDKARWKRALAAAKKAKAAIAKAEGGE